MPALSVRAGKRTSTPVVGRHRHADRAGGLQVRARRGDRDEPDVAARAPPRVPSLGWRSDSGPHRELKVVAEVEEGVGREGAHHQRQAGGKRRLGLAELLLGDGDDRDTVAGEVVGQMNLDRAGPRRRW